MSKLLHYRRIVDRVKDEAKHAARLVTEEQRALLDAEAHYDYCVEAQRLVQSIAHTVQEEAHKRIDSVVTRCLESVFDDPYEFKIVMDKKRGKTEARLIFVKDGREVDPTSAAGGGAVDVAAFALLVVCLTLSRPPLRRVLILDEPFRFVSKNYMPRVKAMVERLSRELGVQFVIVTHSPLLEAGVVVEL